jgi:hypothetical protein
MQAYMLLGKTLKIWWDNPLRLRKACTAAAWHALLTYTISLLQVLALELLMILLENSGEVFRTSEKFSSAIKQYLCLSLLKNCTSSIPQAFALSCSIFLTLMAKFRHSLKAEIGVFFPMIMLKAIEAPQVPAGTPFGEHLHCQQHCLNLASYRQWSATCLVSAMWEL